MVPNGWEIKQLADLTTKISDGIHSTPKYTEKSDIHFINGNNLKNGSITISSTTKKVCPEDAENHGRDLSDRTILMSINGTIGNLAFYNNENVVLGKSACYINVNHDVDIKYIYYTLDSSKTQAFYTTELTGSTIKNLSLKTIKSTKILTPPLQEQQKIAKILTTWDKAINATERLIDNSKQQKKSLMQQLLTGKKRLLDDNGKRFEGEWEEFQLSDLALSGKNNFTDGDWVESVHIKDSGCRLIQTGNIGVGYFKNKNKKYISKDSFDELKCTEVHVGDLLICRLAEPAGRACIVPDIGESKMLTSVDVIIMRTDTTKALTKYLSYYFSLNHTLHRVSALCGGSTRSRVSRSVLGKMKLSLPDVQEQQKIAAVLTTADKEIELLEQQLADLQQEKKALMQVLLTGKKRVKLND